jgi:hypothetical protein
MGHMEDAQAALSRAANHLRLTRHGIQESVSEIMGVYDELLAAGEMLLRRWEPPVGEVHSDMVQMTSRLLQLEHEVSEAAARFGSH